MRTNIVLLVLLVGLEIVPAASTHGQIRGLVASYSLENGAKDGSGNGHDGTVRGGTVVDGPEGFGKALLFNGTASQFVHLGTWNPSAATGQLSVCLWARWNGLNGGWQGLIAKRDTWAANDMMWQLEANNETGKIDFFVFGGAPPVEAPTLPIGEWAHVAATFDGAIGKCYLNAQMFHQQPLSFNPDTASALVFGAVQGDGGNPFNGALDEVSIYDRALSDKEVSLIMAGYGGAMASNPRPASKTADVPQDVVLSWDPLATATTRDVYFGTAYDDVNDASRARPGDVLASRGQTATTFATAGLEYGRTYYWRIDEVNAPPDGTIFKGNVWSFTTEPFAYPIENITARASSGQGSMGPKSTIDGSGLGPNDEHSTELTQMWVSTGVQPNWIQYEFDKVYKLYELWVWNSNSLLESIMGFGAKDVVIEYSLDGSIWTELEGVPEFAQATGTPDYTHNTTVSFGGVEAGYVKLTVKTSWGPTMTQTSLSEVRFFYVPVQAREPQPADGATGVGLATDVTWRPGREAQSHDVYFGTDADAVAAGTIPAATQTEHSYTPASLEFGTTYYWKVDEVGETETCEGNLWSFTTQEYAIFEDFESYTNDSPNRVFQTWTDGFGFSPDQFFPQGGSGNGSGAIVGYDPGTGDIMERAIVHSGAQSMPLLYDNTASLFYSETGREFATAQNWLDKGADTLALYVRGNAGNFKETADGQIIMSAIGTDIWDTADQFRYAYKNLSGNGSMVVRVDSLIRSDGWAKAGVMIRESLHPGSKHAFACVTPDYGVSFQQRPETGNVMSQVSVAGTVAPRWVKLTRTGNAFTAQQSADGVTWANVTFAAPVNITMANNVLIGLALTSHNASTLTAAEFSNLSTTGSVTGEWQTAEIGATQPVGNSVEPMYVRIEDSTGGKATVVNADEAITLRPTWQQWKISYSDLAGVNLSRVKRMYIGVGNRSAPVAGGTGTVYIDDIALGRPLAP
jgi:regulation of enolase protein 1 (concanavalin A-like superfamily)